MADTLVDSELFRDHISTVDQKGKRVWINPKMPKGKFTKYRNIISYILLLVLFVQPFIRINGHPFMLFNIPQGKFIIAGAFFGSQDLFLFALFMLAGIIAIALFTVVYGRIFCGWICPQTIFMEHVFRKIDYLIEGDYTRQKALRNSSWNTEKITKRAVKYVVYLFISFLISNTFLAYIVGTDTLYKYITHGPAENISLFISLCIFTGVFFFVFAWMREQVCIIVCPYGRMQSVLLDRKSIVVAYDFKRGEKRGNPKKNKNNPELGDCIDCGQCVNVCPTGIDIRNGTQLECIGCTACIDACDGIMDKINKPRGLVRYASVENIEKGKKFKFNLRIGAYSAVLLLIITVISILLYTRDPLRVQVLRVPGSTFQMQADGRISNIYQIKFSSRIFQEFRPDIRLLRPKGEIKIIGEQPIVEGGESAEATVLVILPPSELHELKENIQLGIYKDDELMVKQESTFFAPIK